MSPVITPAWLADLPAATKRAAAQLRERLEAVAKQREQALVKPRLDYPGYLESWREGHWLCQYCACCVESEVAPQFVREP
jgi:hypothetical protein